MEGFEFVPKREDMERWNRRLAETRVWWIEFSPIVERLFCDTAHLAAATEADYGIQWLGIGSGHRPRRVPTDRPDVWLLEYDAPIERMAVSHEWMAQWMEVVRANQRHGRYREAGTERWYEF